MDNALSPNCESTGGHLMKSFGLNILGGQLMCS